MATVTTAKPRADVRIGPGPTDWMGGWKVAVFGSLALCALAGVHWWYEAREAWTIGIDASTPEFTQYYRTLFWGQLLLLGAGTGLWWGWLVRTGNKIIDQAVTAEEEVRRIAVFWGLVAMSSFTLFFMASFWPNQDASWHQTAIRDTALTPPHIAMFFLWFPLGITMTVGTYLYGRYRLPKVYGPQKGFPWSFFFLIGASITEMMQVAFNEWGHSVWIAEEFFAAPFHWPFVTYGWLASGIFALWAETVIRLLQIEKEVEERAALPAGAD